MEKKLLLSLIACFAFLLCKPQLKLYESTFNGGVVGGGYSVGATLPSGSGSFSVTIPGGSTIRRAYLIAGRCGAAPNVTVTLNGTPFTFSSANQMTTGWSTIYGGISAVHAIDVTSSISAATSSYTIATPTQNTVSDKYPEFYLYIAFDNGAMPAVSSAVFLNNTNLNVNSFPWALTTTAAVTNGQPVGLALLGGYATFSPDCEQVIVNGTNIGSFGGQDFNASSQWGCMAGFQYYNGVLTGYNDDNANQAMSGTDALSNIQAVIPASTNNIPVTFTHCGGGSDNHVWAAFLTWGGVILDAGSLHLDPTPLPDRVRLDGLVEQVAGLASYELQRSSDGETFSTIHTIGDAPLPASFTWDDEHPRPGTNWYRLRVVDEDGLAQFSAAQEVFWDRGGSVVLRYGPNPVPVGGTLGIELQQLGRLEWRIISLADGRELLDGALDLHLSHQLPTQDLPAGAYALQLADGRRSQVVKFVVE